MKKTIFTFCSIAIVCCAIFFACAKDDNSITHVTYAPQASGGTGGNPNPNGAPSNSGYGTTTSSTAASTTGATTGSTTSSTSGTTTAPTNTTTTNFSIDGNAQTNPTSSANVQSGNYYVTAFVGSGTPNIQITFPGTTPPATGNYAVVSGAPSGNQCNFMLTTSTGSSSASAGTVTVTILGTSNTAAFGGITCSGPGGAHTVTGAIKY